MKKLFILLFGVLFAIGAQSQNQDWHPVRTGDTYFYNQSEFRSYRIDSIVEHNNFVEMYSFPEFFVSDMGYCFNPFGPSWIGKKIEVYQDSTLIYNLNNEPICLIHTPELDKTWTLWKSASGQKIEVKTSYTSYTSDHYFEDSILTLEIISTGDFKGQQIIISKNHGLVSGYNFLFFPNIENEFNTIDRIALVGQQSIKESVQNLTSFDIYNFNIGDEFHTEEVFKNYSDYLEYTVYYTDQIATVTSKWYNTDSSIVTYGMHICSNNGEFDKQESYSLMGTKIDGLSYQFYFATSDMEGTMVQTYNEQGIPLKYFGTGFQKQTDSCYTFIYFDKKKAAPAMQFPWIEGFYLKGLGGPFYCHYLMYSERWKTLKYYKKGEVEWGNPYDCEKLLSAVEDQKARQILVYPNPAIDYIAIDFTGLVDEVSLTLYNGIGKQVLRTSVCNGEPIILSNLPEGIYFYEVTSKGISVKTGTLIKN